MEQSDRKGQPISDAERRHRAVFEQSPYGILIIDIDGNFIDFNRAAHEQLGYTREEFAGLRLSDIDPFESPEEIQASMREVLTKRKAEFEVRHRTKDGEIRDVNVITQTMDLAGRTVFHTMWNDVTDRRRVESELKKYHENLKELITERTAELEKANRMLASDIDKRELLEEKLRESEERFRLIAETSIDVIFQIDLDGFVGYSSPSIEQFGYASSEVKGTHFSNYFFSAGDPGPLDVFRQAISGESINQHELKFRRKDGTPGYCEINVTPLVKNDRVIGIQGIARDITNRKKAEWEREKLIEELKDAVANIKTLKGLIPICAWCKKIRDDSGYWKRVETYIQEHSDASFTSGICPECLKKNDYATYKEVFGEEKQGKS